MTPDNGHLDGLLITERDHWLEGPPYELFEQMRRECPVHRTERITDSPRPTASGR